MNSNQSCADTEYANYNSDLRVATLLISGIDPRVENEDKALVD